ncbi:GTP-binding protein [Desulfonispora thiosulfatigenes DSM 11270]|uniref:Large ribosomal subunit assembly factor BipA n=1 Tax=Desulfonispora thiosulfatigenes DSM 11270 TaxID=656914 RepID=A0A1W1VEK5_DESTI|nr:translational GTPase TypA [Desulfonispora thiosulfatigenes]SMB91384.1 GTP-binding protein [Desulfonispora thiosulfatigenes DSM 11270]
MIKEKIRNIAIIAHVDHGKTTLVDQLLSQSGIYRENEKVTERVMDSNDLEKERGITILAKNTSISYEGYKINIIDTPGHADFGGEVERIMKMVDGVVLVVDAFEGCMPQTKFVLKKALEQNLVPILVVNKIDRENARVEGVVDEVLDLFIDLGANEDQIEFPVIYASGLRGIAGETIDSVGEDIVPLFNTIIKHIPCPSGELEAPLQMQVTLLDYSDYLGRIGIGVIKRGTIKNGTMASIMKRDGKVETLRISKLYGFEGLKRVEIQEASVGEIVAVSGMGDLNVGETVCSPECVEALDFIKIDEPTLQMSFIVNNSPFAGKEGDPITARKLGARLMKEMETDVSLKVSETDRPEIFLVAGRGELHLSILIENMRREGYEFQVSKPQVIFKKLDGVKMEPFENLTIDVPEEYLGTVMEKIGIRKGELVNMNNINGEVRVEYSIPARGLVGFRNEFLTDTRGYGILNHSFDEYKPYKGEITSRRNGVLIAFETGTASNYGLVAAEERGTLFISAGTDVYEGMVVGENSREQDMEVNICKHKNLTNMRTSGKDDTVKLKAPRILSLEEAISYAGDDEYLEVTPESIRLRKKYLDKSERVREAKSAKLMA